MNHCEACGVKEYGKIYDEILEESRGHQICAWCKDRWLEKEIKLGRRITFQEFVKGVTFKELNNEEWGPVTKTIKH